MISRFVKTAVLSPLLSFPLWAQSPQPVPRGEQVIEPELERREIIVPKIDTENFEITAFGGVLNVEDFGSHAAYGTRIAYHVTEDFFVEGAYARSRVSDESFRNFGLTIFEESEEDLQYYNLSVGWNAFPGEVFVWRGRALTSAIYLIGGAGNTQFNDEDFFTVSAGFGAKILPTDYLSLRLEVRDHLFSSDLLGESKTTNNIEITGNLGFLY